MTNENDRLENLKMNETFAEKKKKTKKKMYTCISDHSNMSTKSFS